MIQPASPGFLVGSHQQNGGLQLARAVWHGAFMRGPFDGEECSAEHEPKINK